MSMARTTPAQKPRGWARITCMNYTSIQFRRTLIHGAPDEGRLARAQEACPPPPAQCEGGEDNRRWSSTDLSRQYRTARAHGFPGDPCGFHVTCLGRICRGLFDGASVAYCRLCPYRRWGYSLQISEMPGISAIL